MNTKTSISTNRYDEKALSFLLTCRLYFSLSYCLITTQVIVIKRIRHYQIVLMQWLITTPRLIGIYTHKVLSPIILSNQGERNEKQIQCSNSKSGNANNANIRKDAQVYDVSDNDILSCVYRFMVSSVRTNDIVTINFITKRRAYAIN
jgi:hypothetical protein